MSHPDPSNDGVTFFPCSPIIAAIVVEVDGPHELRPTQWPVIGYEMRSEKWPPDPRYFAVVLGTDGEAHCLHELLMHPDPDTGHRLRCTRFVAIGGQA